MFEITLNAAAAALVNDRAQVKIFPKHRRDGSQLGIRPTKFVHKEGQFKDATVPLVDAGEGKLLLRVTEDALSALNLNLTDGAVYQLIDISSRCYRFAPVAEVNDGTPAATVKVTDYVEPAPVPVAESAEVSQTKDEAAAAPKTRKPRAKKVTETTPAPEKVDPLEVVNAETAEAPAEVAQTEEAPAEEEVVLVGEA